MHTFAMDRLSEKGNTRSKLKELEVLELNFLFWLWDGMKYLVEMLGRVISFKLSFIFLLCIAYYGYKVFMGIFDKSFWHRTRGTEK